MTAVGPTAGSMTPAPSAERLASGGEEAARQVPTPSGGAPARIEARGRWFREWSVRYAVIVAWVVEILIFTFLDPNRFLTATNFGAMFGSEGSVLVLALAVVPTLSQNDIDLSVVGVMTVSAIIVGELNGVDHWSLWSSILVAMVAALLVGVVNGLVTVRIGVQSMLVTLGMATLLVGMAGFIDHNTTVGGVSPALASAMNTNVGGISAAFYYALALTVALWYLFRHTPAGRRMLFVGRGAEVARLSGVRVSQLRMIGFILGAVLAGFAGVISIGVTGGLEATSLQPLLLPAFAAAFVSTAIFYPGQVNAAGTFVAILFLETGIQGLELKGLSSWVETAFYGAALIVAVIVSRIVFLKARKREAR